MAAVNKNHIKSSLAILGIQQGDTVIFHSSLKSFGTVEGGADAVIDALLETVGKTGTVVAPTLIQKDFSDAYNTWYMDKPSDVGIITEVFRKRNNSMRSNHPTHSISAIGKNAKHLTETHGQSGQRYGVFGNTPFSVDSPWQKMFDENAKVLLIGVGFDKFTFKHLFEYILVEEILNEAEKRGKYEVAVKSIRNMNIVDYNIKSETFFWPFINTKMGEFAADYCNETMCGDALIKCISLKPFGDDIMRNIREYPEDWWEGNILDWMTQNK